MDTADGLDDAFLGVVKEHTAGSPMNETIKWTNLSRAGIAEKLNEKDFTVSVTAVASFLKSMIFALARRLR